MEGSGWEVGGGARRLEGGRWVDGRLDGRLDGVGGGRWKVGGWGGWRCEEVGRWEGGSIFPGSQFKHLNSPGDFSPNLIRKKFSVGLAEKKKLDSLITFPLCHTHHPYHIHHLHHHVFPLPHPSPTSITHIHHLHPSPTPITYIHHLHPSPTPTPITFSLPSSEGKIFLGVVEGDGQGNARQREGGTISKKGR